MRYYDKITPDGTKDLLFSECDQRSQVTKTLKDLFGAPGIPQSDDTGIGVL